MTQTTDAPPTSRTAPPRTVPDAGQRTFRPDPDADGVEVGVRRRPGAMTLAERLDVAGAALASVCITALLFGRLTSMNGVLGALLVAYVGFLVVYALLAGLSSGWQAVKSKIVTVMLTSAATTLLVALVFIIVFTVFRGRKALVHLNFFTEDLSLTGPLSPLDVGGILHAILGTLIQISIALAITIPLGLSTAVYLNEVKGRFATFVRTVVEAMTALPSIVAGLFVYAAVIQGLGLQKSGLAAAFAITVMMLPIVIRAADVVLRLVPGNLREASQALGSTQWRTVWHVVLPTARPGLSTAVILGTARGIGETSPVLLTAGISAAVNLNPLSGPMISLPLQVFEFVKSPEPAFIARGFGTAAVLLILVLLLFAVARGLGGRSPQQLSRRHARAVARASRQDAARFAVREGARDTLDATSTS